jgi:hypothetical protein
MNFSVETLDDDNKTNEQTNYYNSENINLTLVEKVETNIQSNDLEIQKELLVEDKVFGNDINIKRPSKMGKVFTSLYIMDNPLIVIGPDCIKYIK